MRSARRLYVHHWEFGTWGREKKTKNKRPRSNRRACTPTAIQALFAEREFQAPCGAAGIARCQGRTAYGQQVARSLKFHQLLLPVGEAAEALQLLRLGHGSVGKHLQILSRVTPSQLVFLPSQNSVRSSD